MQRVHDNGHVYKGIYEGWYCPRCADFKTEHEIGPDNTCPIHKIPLDREKRGELVLPALRLPGAARAALRGAARTSCCPRVALQRGARRSSPAACRTSRSAARKLTWGVTVPWDPSQVFYVWFDALLNYYTALSLRARRRGPDRHVLAGRLPHHRQGHPQVPRGLLARDADGRRHRAARSTLFIHGFLLMKDASGEEHKMSKSLGNVLDPFEVMDQFGTDALRYYCFREVSFGQDGSVSTDDVRGALRRPSSPTSTATSPAARWR